MSSTGREASGVRPEAQPRVEDVGPSPFWPRHLAELFLRPQTFFSKNLALGQPLYVAVVTWSFGITNAIDRMHVEMMREELGRPQPWWERLGPALMGSWWAFWLWVAVAGAISALFLWWVGGWWYRVRLQWSGATNPDKRQARLVYVYAAFVASGPSVVAAMVQTVLYPNLAAAYASEDWLSTQLTNVLIVLSFWSIVTGYIGVTTRFSVEKWKARIWFGVLPALLYVVAFGLITALFSLVAQRAS